MHHHPHPHPPQPPLLIQMADLAQNRSRCTFGSRPSTTFTGQRPMNQGGNPKKNGIRYESDERYSDMGRVVQVFRGTEGGNRIFGADVLPRPKTQGPRTPAPSPSSPPHPLIPLSKKYQPPKGGAIPTERPRPTASSTPLPCHTVHPMPLARAASQDPSKTVQTQTVIRQLWATTLGKHSRSLRAGGGGLGDLDTQPQARPEKRTALQGLGLGSQTAAAGGSSPAPPRLSPTRT